MRRRRPTSFIASQPQSVAVDENTGDIYVTDAQDSVVDRFQPDGSYDLQIANGAFDFSAAPASLVVDGAGNLDRTDGELVELDPATGEKTGASMEDFAKPLQCLQGQAGMPLGGWADEEREDIERPTIGVAG